MTGRRRDGAGELILEQKEVRGKVRLPSHGGMVPVIWHKLRPTTALSLLSAGRMVPV